MYISSVFLSFSGEIKKKERKNGFTKRLMGFYERAEEILACPGNRDFIITWIFDCNRRRVFHRAIHLYPVLI